ncbi:MAG: serine/threonine-protein kinase [Anaerolineae bacterium]|jgi:serine/threonine-protein kinase|nr:serine/threonine-protein kinase [Anaerolineae bacterium]
MSVPLKNDTVLKSRYSIRRIIGQGGAGCIYLADDLRLEGRQCALKEVEHDQSLPADLLQEARDQFMREATVLARLDHPNLPKVSDFFNIKNREYLVMDFVPGKDLRTMMIEARQRNEFLDEDEVLNWASQLADAISYLHNQETPILHRDIKPSNLKVTPTGLLKLVDFGLVKVAAPGEVTVTIVQGQGTAIYTPLEQYGGDNAHTDVRSDIYSFGATFYHLLTNVAPPVARERFLDNDLLKPITEINPKISFRTEQAISWAMSMHPDDRPESIAVFEDALLGSAPLDNRPRTGPISARRRGQSVNFYASALQELFGTRVERTLWAIAGGAMLLTLLLTILL